MGVAGAQRAAWLGSAQGWEGVLLLLLKRFKDHSSAPNWQTAGNRAEVSYGRHVCVWGGPLAVQELELQEACQPGS